MWWVTWLGCTGTMETTEPEVEVQDDPVTMLTRACEGGDAAKCTRLAERYAAGDGVEADAGRAAELYSQGCGGGHAAGCVALAAMHETGEGLPKDLARAAQLLGTACDAGDGAACHRLADMHLDARGVPEDVPRALKLLRGACTGGVGESCRQLATLYGVGARVPRDTDQSRSYAKAACGHGDVLGCCRLAERQILDGDDRSARSTLSSLLEDHPDLEGVDPLIVRGLQVAAGEKSEKVGEELIEAWRESTLTSETWSWKPLTEHLADEKRRKSRESRVVIELLDAPRAAGTEAALAAALDLPG